MRTFHQDNTIPRISKGKGDPKWVWVFGSNLAGRHGAGAAKVARVNFNAEYGIGSGPTGRSYAIPTKDKSLKSLPLEQVASNIAEFLAYAAQNPDSTFFITRVGCGLAGFEDKDIAPLFVNAPDNCSFAHEWGPYIQPDQPLL